MSSQPKELQAHLDQLFAEARHACDLVIAQTPPSDGLYCPAQWDGWTCFNFTLAGSHAYVPCPALPIFNPRERVHRYCEENGTWWLDGQGRTWSDHSDCLNNRTSRSTSGVDPAFSSVYLFIAGASLSLVLLLISLAIFFGFRQLRCDRITIHKNLFISFACTALTWILYYNLVVLDGEIILENTIWCRYLHSLAQYFTATNFSWMSCEALYLHILMAHALHTGKKLVKCLALAGWGVPLVLTAIYAAVRATSSSDNDKCWIEDSSTQWIIAGPIFTSVLINICILVNLVRLLMTKLQQVPDAQQSRKTVKATLILVPLFGLQFLIFPVRPSEDSPLHTVYLHFMAALMSLQGTMVSVIFCFCNGEVQAIIVRKWQQHRLMSSRTGRKHMALTFSTYVDGYSVVDTTRDATKMMPDNAIGTVTASGASHVGNAICSLNKGGNCSLNQAGTCTEALEMKPPSRPPTSIHTVSVTTKQTTSQARDQVATEPDPY